MHWRSRRSSILLPAVLLLALLLAACGGGAAPATSTSAPTEEPTVAPTDVPPTVEATDDAEASAATEVADAEGTPEAEATDEAASAGSGEASAADAGEPVVRIEQDSTSLRAGPGVSYDRVATANSGDLLPALGRSGAGQTLWFQVDMPDGTIAWAWSRVATLLPEGADIPEVEPPPAS